MAAPHQRLRGGDEPVQTEPCKLPLFGGESVDFRGLSIKEGRDPFLRLDTREGNQRFG